MPEPSVGPDELAFEAGAPNKQTVLTILSRLLDNAQIRQAFIDSRT